MVAVLTVGAALAQGSSPTGPITVAVTDWARALDSIQRYIDDGQYSDARSGAYRGLARKIRDEATVVRLEAEEALAATTA